jgi:Flp pilus assembly protein TadG
MTPVLIFDSLRRRVRSFNHAKAGNVIVTFGLAFIPMVAMVGAAVDYSRGNNAKVSMQSAIDATGLMLSKEVSTLNAAQINQKADSEFRALLNRTDIQNLVVTPSYTSSTTDGYQLNIAATGKLPVTFMRILGRDTLDLQVDTLVRWGNTRLRVALVLDNTGSMASANKLTALQTATNSLIDQLKNAAQQNEDIYVSIIPFVKDVNVDPANYNQTWIDWTDWDAANGTCSRRTLTSKSSCQAAGRTWTPTNHNTWNGCITDRGNSGAPSSNNYDTNVVQPAAGNTATYFPAEQYSSCPHKILPLTYDWTAMKTLVSNMIAAGNTNQAIGLAHGWMSLVGGGPYPPPPVMDAHYQYKQVIILLTDGLNTQDRWYTTDTQIDARQQMTCNNIKAANITIYTVQVNTDGDPTSTLLQNCASGSDKFFLLTSSTQIVTTFNQIGTALANLYLAK